MAMGNQLSAQGRLSTIEMDRTVPEFSLLQMVKGMFKESGKTPDHKAALELYSEGVVFGSLTDSWMPELLYRTAMGIQKYKKILWLLTKYLRSSKRCILKIPFTNLGKKRDSRDKEGGAKRTIPTKTTKNSLSITP